MPYIPHEKLSIKWINNETTFRLSLPWVSMDIDVTEEDKGWIKDATQHLHSTPANSNVQRFINDLKDYPIFYIQPRSLQEFDGKDLEVCPQLDVDSSTPSSLLATFGCNLTDDLKKETISAWTWDWKKILDKAQIAGTHLYDPVSFISYLICYRLEWESTTWSGQGGFTEFLRGLLKRDETQFFQAIGWITKQSWYVKTNVINAMMPALIYFNRAQEQIQRFMFDEVSHYKFMEEVFKDLNLNKGDFSVGEGTKWLLAAHNRTAKTSPLAFSALINLFETASCEGQDSRSCVIRSSSKPHAVQGYDLHYKINREHRHCDVPLILASRLKPQTYSHAALTLGLFELTLNFLHRMEKKFAQTFGVKQKIKSKKTK